MSGTGHEKRASQFLRVAHRFQLGHLPTEQSHPQTRELSRWARDALPRAVSVLKQIDLQALRALESYAAKIDRLAQAIAATLGRGRRVFLCGCGATGRLSLSLEFLWRHEGRDGDDVLSFMAGGDTALVHALEGFEDHAAHGARHLLEMGFGEGDLLIACTEGGETPYVLGATERAAELSSNPPFLLYCNPDSSLIRRTRRFRRVHENPRIRKVCLFVGPMALAGSTRMQASTVLQLAVGSALLHPDLPARQTIARFRAAVADCDFGFLPDFIEREAAAYSAGHGVAYRVRDYGITVFTDTTERAPTFSLAPFDRLGQPGVDRSMCCVVLEEADDPAAAWARLLHRAPRPLNWPEIDARTTLHYLYGFDFSLRAADRWRRRFPDGTHREFRIRGSGDGIELRWDSLVHEVSAAGLPALHRHLLLKQLLNIHSTLVMGRLGRYEGNMMTWVVPTNGKLVDRATRCVQQLVVRAGRAAPRYEAVVRQLFAESETLGPDESVVLRTFQTLMQNGRPMRGGGRRQPAPDRRPRPTPPFESYS